jgi:hypothetical protein
MYTCVHSVHRVQGRLCTLCTALSLMQCPMLTAYGFVAETIIRLTISFPNSLFAKSAYGKQQKMKKKMFLQLTLMKMMSLKIKIHIFRMIIVVKI